MCSRSSTMSMISSTTSPIERPSSANTRIGCEPWVWTVTPFICTSGISCSRYCNGRCELDLVGGDLLQPGDEPERHRLGLARAGAEHQERGELFAADRMRRGGVGQFMGRGAEAPSAFAMPLGSMIMIGAIAQMVLPENMSMCRSLVDIGLTTISSVWNTPSTTMPKVWLPTCVTTMKPFSGSDEPSSIFNSFFRCISGNSLLRNLSTAVSLMRSMRCSELARARTSSTTDSCGIAKVAGGFHDQGRDDGERQRDLDGDGGALAGHRLDVDGAADLVDIGAHHVHADAAAGDRGDGGRGREAGAKMNLWIWASVIFSSSASLTRPFCSALALIRSVLSPRPLSAMQMMMWPPS